MTPDEHRADLATQHEDAAVEARGDIIRERTYWGGNAVTPPSSRDLIAVGVEALGGAA